ncbi:MAG: hypothetical protein V4641_03930 [Pseudomonadota bacterium]
MTEPRNDYGFPFPADEAQVLVMLMCPVHGAQLVAVARQLSPLERAQAYAADVRARRGMVVRKGYYVDLKS